METFDLLLRSAAFALSLAAATAILTRPGRYLGMGYVAFAVGGIGAFMAASAPGVYSALGLGAFVFNAWCLATPVALWILARVLFEEQRGPNPWHLAGGGLLVAFTMAADYGRYELGVLSAHPDLAASMLIAGRVMGIALLAAACVNAVAHWRSDLVEHRRRMRVAFVAVIGTVFMISAGSEVVFAGHGAPIAALVTAHSALLVLVFVILQLVARGALEELLPAAAAPRTAKRAALSVVRGDGGEMALAARVVDAMASERLWKREGLGIGQLAAALGCQEHLLRRAINRHLGYRNFNDFLHQYRLREAADRLVDPAQEHLPVLSIALDCGYGSIGPFNRAFKVRFGVTPTQYRHLAAHPPAEVHSLAEHREGGSTP